LRVNGLLGNETGGPLRDFLRLRGIKFKKKAGLKGLESEYKPIKHRIVKTKPSKNRIRSGDVMLELFAPAKINLTLDILEKRADGYHEVETVMQTIALGDTIHITEAADIEVECDHPAVPPGRANLAARAA
ncbi:MAG TPA: hypothetical protein DEA44_04105, partial [Firmicutes bacterium]|nr:hypothetical protein [Bacillota bacterium]